MMGGPIEKSCGHCGQRFECGQYGCWCGKVRLTDRQFDWIAARFQDCLCSDCLEQVRAGLLGPPSHAGEAPSGAGAI